MKDTDKPTVVHIHTEKGHGFAPAVANKEAWHWGMPFNLEDGSRPRSGSTTRRSGSTTEIGMTMMMTTMTMTMIEIMTGIMTGMMTKIKTNIR